jgi:acylphosphatase
MKAASRISIEGHVQGVFFREWTLDKARELDASGWVRNRRDGRVEIYAVGEEAALRQFLEALHAGSPASRADRVQSEDALVEKVEGFTRRQTI